MDICKVRVLEIIMFNFLNNFFLNKMLKECPGGTS
jgi:hypothetical protein